MAYEVTATRKRPRTFEELEGQEFVVSTLENSLKEQAFAHAYLFAGPRGVGKTSAARILAKAFNCEKGPSPQPCGHCTNCTEITKGNSLDVIEIDGASNTGVDDIREIKDEVLFAPNNSRFKVYIIDEVHMLSNSAFNALLKTIEEPPPYIVFVFATTEIHKVPATIRSRCQQFNFRLIGINTIKDRLTAICDEKNISYEEDAIFWIAKEATGSLRDAYTLFDQVVSFSDNDITLAKIQNKLGMTGLDTMNTLIEAACASDSETALETCTQALLSGIPVEQFVIDLAEYLRGVLFLSSGIKNEAVIGFNPERFSSKVTSSLVPEQIEYMLEQTLQLYRNIRYSLNQKYELELVVSKFCYVSSYISPGEILRRIEELKKTTTRQAAAAPVAGSPPEQQNMPEPAGQPVIRKMSVDELKKELIANVRKIKLTLASTLEAAVDWQLDESELTLVYENLFAANTLKQEMNVINQAFSEISQQPINITIEMKKSDGDTGEKKKPDSQIDLMTKVFRAEIIQNGREK